MTSSYISPYDSYCIHFVSGRIYMRKAAKHLAILLICLCAAASLFSSGQRESNVLRLRALLVNPSTAAENISYTYSMHEGPNTLTYLIVAI